MDPRLAGETDAVRGLTIPGLANCHSHAFHRALRGRTQTERGSFWTWREQMYAVAAELTPETYFELARDTYAEMRATGISAVGEFHYLHHQPDGTPYDDPNEMGMALLAAADEVGIRIRLLDTCYLAAGIGRPPEGVQVRFSDGDADTWAERVAAFDDPRVGAAIHSVRAVPRDQLKVVVEAAVGMPLHVHVSEQVAENEACVAAYDVTPTQLLAEAGALGPLTTAVHATHLSDDDIRLLGESRTNVCFCPTTERDLADGIGPARRLHDAGATLTLGSDSHAVIDLFEEMRAVEMHERLASQRRGHWSAAELTAAASYDGHRSLGFDDAGRIAEGQRADLVTIDLESIRTRGVGATPETVVFAATAADASTIGRQVMTSLLLTGIAELVTNDPTHDGTPLGLIEDAAVVVEGRRIVWVGRRLDAPDADASRDLGGRAVLPGFVDSHSHLVFAGDRADEFAARMAGESYAAGGIRTTVAATRAATDEQLSANVARLVAEMRRQGTTTVEIKSGYGLTTLDEARCLAVARQFTEETTFLGAHVVPPEYADDPAATSTSSPARCWTPPPRTRAGSTPSANAAPSTTSRRGRSCSPERDRVCRAGCTPTSSGPGRACSLPASWASLPSTTAPTSTMPTSSALADSGTIATLLPGVEFSTRSPYPDARGLIDAGVTVALASDCNPGSCYTSSMPLCVALAVREMRMTPAEAVWSATAGGARALGREDVGVLAPGARAHLTVLDAPSYLHLAYRPGVPLVAEVIA